jgi:hypothetical protein
MYENNSDAEVMALMLSCCSVSVLVIIIGLILAIWHFRSQDGEGVFSWVSGPKGGKKQGTPVPITSSMLKKNSDPWNIAGFGGDEKSMSIKGDAIVYRLKKNMTGGNSGGMFTANPLKKFPTEEIRLEFDVFLPDNFPLKPDANIEIVGGKLWGVCLGKQFKDCATGGNYSASSGSVRITFNAEKDLVATVYVYPTATSSDAAWKDQGAEYKRYGDAGKKGHKLFLGKGKAMPLRHGWNSVSLYVKLNTPKKQDGVIRATVNGVTNQVSDAVLRNDAAVKLNNLKGNVFIGGSGKAWEFNRDVDVSIKNVHIA